MDLLYYANIMYYSRRRVDSRDQDNRSCEYSRDESWLGLRHPLLDLHLQYNNTLFSRNTALLIPLSNLFITCKLLSTLYLAKY